MSRRDAEHYVAEVDESEVVEIDSVKLAKRKSNLWLDAWRDLRRRPLFYVALALVGLEARLDHFPPAVTGAIAFGGPAEERLELRSLGAVHGVHFRNLDQELAAKVLL